MATASGPLSRGLMNAVEISRVGASMEAEKARIGLLEKQIGQDEAKLAQQQARERFDAFTKLLAVPNQSDEYYQAQVNGITDMFGLERLNIGDRSKEALKEVGGIIKSARENPSTDYRPAIDALYAKYGTSKETADRIDKAKAELAGMKKETAGNYVAQVLGSGGVTDPAAAAGAFARSGGTPELREAGAAAEKQIRESAKTTGDPKTFESFLVGEVSAGRLSFDQAAKKMAEFKKQSTEAGDPGALETARQAFIAGKASKEQLALINQDRDQYTKDYLSIFQGTVVTPRKHSQLRNQAGILFDVERMKKNPLPSAYTAGEQRIAIDSASAAVRYLVDLAGFDEDTAKEITRQIMLLETGATGAKAANAP